MKSYFQLLTRFVSELFAWFTANNFSSEWTVAETGYSYITFSGSEKVIFYCYKKSPNLIHFSKKIKLWDWMNGLEENERSNIIGSNKEMSDSYIRRLGYVASNRTVRVRYLHLVTDYSISSNTSIPNNRVLSWAILWKSFDLQLGTRCKYLYSLNLWKKDSRGIFFFICLLLIRNPHFPVVDQTTLL